ncbi:MAG: hypothetical protein J2P31_00220 [Blastocatellia bacterium]|nr:hypothetical protein [Blastocatellia bacterium]
MTELFNLSVSPHAISQFQERIAPMEESKARLFIMAGIIRSTNRKLLPAKNGYPETIRVRTRRPFPFEFRAYCIFDEARGHFVVTTIVRGDCSVRRKQHRRALQYSSPSEIRDAY